MFSRVKRETVIDVVHHGVFLLVLYIIQAEILPWLGTGAVPMLLAVAASGVGHFEGRLRGAVCGLFAGVLCDVALGLPVITFTLTLTGVGFLSGYLGETILSQQFPSYLLCCFATMAVVSFIQMFSLMFFRGAPVITLLITAAIQTAVSLACAVPLYPLVKRLARRLN